MDLSAKAHEQRRDLGKGGSELGTFLRKNLPDRGNCKCKGPMAAMPGALHLLLSFPLSAEAPLSTPPPQPLCSVFMWQVPVGGWPPPLPPATLLRVHMAGLCRRLLSVLSHLCLCPASRRDWVIFLWELPTAPLVGFKNGLLTDLLTGWEAFTARQANPSPRTEMWQVLSPLS